MSPITASHLAPDSHTARRLEHGTPEHLHETARRVFIGPIPEGWLKTHRKQWYRQYVGSRARRAPTFTAAQPLDDADRRDSATNGAAIANGAGGSAGQGGRTIDEPTFRLSNASNSNDVVGAAGADGPASTTSLLRSQTSQRLSSATEVIEQEEARTIDGNIQHANTLQHPSILQTHSSGSRLDKVVNKLPGSAVRFTEAGRLQLRARASRLAAKGSFRGHKVKDGEMMKVDKMLVRVDITQQSLREDFDEKISQSVDTRTLDKWREFIVVCRKCSEEGAEAVLQLYQTRVINVSEDGKVKKKPKVRILLSNSKARVNMYSALDKTLCVWTTIKSRTTIFYMRAPSSASAVEWYTFLRGVLGHRRAGSLQINVPDLSVTLRLEDPFQAEETLKTLNEAIEGDDEALAKAVNVERGAAGVIVARCIEMLKQEPRWQNVLEAWAKEDRIGLAWKRYDRLEWVYGAVEQRMYGTIAMQRTHDLELRPKNHYPMITKVPDGPTLREPPPIEGFLIRLTSQKGKERQLGRMLFKRLYYFTQNQYLFFLQPAKATPPPPPKMPLNMTDSNVPSAKDITTQTPLAYSVDPYPLQDKKIAWIDGAGIVSAREQHDRDQGAVLESNRNFGMLLVADGFVNLCDVQLVRLLQDGVNAGDDNIDDGDEVDFHVQVPDTRREDGATDQVDQDRAFELQMKNGLVVRLQAYNKVTRDEWMKRLRQLVNYWTIRTKADMDMYKSTREQNLRELGIDERAEAVVGQFAYKWEVGKSFASPALYNMCGISECRTIHLSGVLFRKPRKHTTFNRCHVILSHGHMLIFQDSLRKHSGKQLGHSHHERISSINLQGCYLYSGLLTENDLLYQNQTFDSNMPGHHALPRLYREDAWTSTDEDAMTTFVIWHAKSNTWFNSSQHVDDVDENSKGDQKTRTKLKRVSQLGATGRNVVFKARSRAERDHWVLAIQVEIERLASQTDEVRLVNMRSG